MLDVHAHLEKLKLRSSKSCAYEEAGGTLKVKVDQKLKTGNSEDGNREWNANMAVKLFLKTEKGLSYQQNPVYTQKRKSHPPFCKTKANYSVGKYKLQKTRSQQKKNYWFT